MIATFPNRRDFIRTIAAGTLAAGSAVSLSGCAAADR